MQQHTYGITNLIYYLVSTYYAHLSSILIVYDNPSNIASHDLQQHYLDDVQQAFKNQATQGNIISLQWINLGYLDGQDDFEKKILEAVDTIAVEGFITILAKTSQFLHARYYASRYSTLRLKDKIYLFLCDLGESPTNILANEILQYGTNNCKYRDINFELWTQQYVGAEGNLNAIHLDTYISCNGTFAKNVQLYPNKLLNLEQRTVRISTLTYLPYVKIRYVPPGEGDVDAINSKGPSKTVQLLGTEAELTKTFCQVRNCHLRAMPYAADYWGTIYENGSSEGVLSDIYNQRSEMAIGCIYNWYNNITETSRFIARSAVTILGPEPTQFPRWRTIVLPFSIGLWLFLVFTIVLCSIAFHLIQLISNRFEKSCGYSKPYEKNLLDVFAIFVQQPSADTGLRRLATRMFLVFLMCATITLENIYSGQLKSFLTMPLFNEPIDTMQKWSLTEWKWAAPSIAWIYSVENSDIAKERRLAKLFEVRNHEFIYNASFWNNYGIGLEKLSHGSFSYGDYVTEANVEHKIVLKDDLYFDWTRAIAIRGWPLMPLFNRHISYFIETGLYIYFEEQISRKFLDNKMQDILKKLSSGSKPKSPPQVLSMEHISGPLFILVVGYLLAFLVFIIEFFSRRIQKKFLKAFTWLKPIFDYKINQ